MRRRALPPRFASRWASTDRARLVAVTLTGTALAVTGLAGFLIVHAVAIVPIWDRAGRGIVPALVAGFTQAYAFEITADREPSGSALGGAAFGLVMFATLAPATILSNALRL